MYKNLENELFKKNISKKSYAEFLGVSEKTVKSKLNGDTDFSYLEFKKTCQMLFPEFNSDYLFANAD